MKIYKVKNRTTGLYRTAGGDWSSKGKAWTNYGHLKSSLCNEGYWGSSYTRGRGTEVVDDIVVIEIEVVETESNCTPLKDIVERERRLRSLEKEFGSVFSSLVKRLEDSKVADKFEWAIVTSANWDHNKQQDEGGISEITKIIKQLKLKLHTDYKIASTWNEGCAVAFASKKIAVMVRMLMVDNDVTSLDLKNFVKTTLDNNDSSPV